MKLYTKENTRIEDDYRVFTGLTFEGKCRFCQGEFKSRSTASKYCSQRCKNDMSIQKKKEAMTNIKKQLTNCVFCNKEITQNKNSKIVKYCSNKCKQANYRKSLK